MSLPTLILHLLNTFLPATRYYTATANGLLYPWTGRVWLNPPYASKLVWRFTHKLCTHLQAGDVTAAIVLVNNATATRWFQELAPLCPVLCFPRRRIRFLTPSGVTGGPLQGQAVLYRESIKNLGVPRTSAGVRNTSDIILYP